MAEGITHLERTLQQYWGFSSFRPYQKEIIISVVKGHDCIGLLPTGGGKSLCYQLPSLILDGITLVVSPLIALMQDQVENLKSRGIQALYLESSKPNYSLDTQLDNLVYGPYKIVFISPERLQNKQLWQRLSQLPLSLIAVDEAHCVSEWGHDFRPAFLEIHKLRNIFKNVPILALTASATPEVVKDIHQQLRLADPQLFQSSFNRPNLSYRISKTADAFAALRKLLHQQPSSSIVYCRSRKQTETLYKHLHAEGFSVDYFHGGKTETEKKECLHAWRNETHKIMIATTAFGMGIDKANVRQVIHMSPPESLESYYQETGRAGRDGQPAQATLLLGPSDFEQLKQQFLHQLPTTDQLKQFYTSICNYLQIAYGEGQEQQYYFDFSTLARTYNISPSKAMHCLTIFDREGLWRWTSHYRQEFHIQFIAPPKKILKILEKTSPKSDFFEQLWRLYPAITAQKTIIKLETMARHTTLSYQRIVQYLKEAALDGWLEVTHIKSDSCLEWLHPREDDYTLAPILHRLKQRYRQKEQKIAQVIHFCETDSVCKRKLLLNYFGETYTQNCQNCSSQSCTTKQLRPKGLEEALLNALKKESASTAELVQNLPFDPPDIVVLLHHWAEANKIQQNDHYEWKLIE